MKNKHIIIISGPTASGKTSTSLSLAKNIQQKLQKKVTIVNFDSLLFYKELNIGTAKPTSDELKIVDHKLINICSAKNPMNAAAYSKIATKEINDLLNDGQIVILVGGSGFYLRALIKGMYESPNIPDELKKELALKLEKEGISPFLDILKENDPESFSSLHENDHYRIVRACEHFLVTGKKLSDEKKRLDQLNPYDFSNNLFSDCNQFHCYLDLPKKDHLQIIEKRAKQMISDGLVDEVQNLLNNTMTGKEKPLQSVGYKEIVEYIQGEYSTLDECIERIEISTRQLAKAQRTFFNKISPKHCFNPINDAEQIIAQIMATLQQ